MFDTHCHLNFSRFKNNVDEVIDSAQRKGVGYIVVPGTDYETSEEAVEIAERHDKVYAAVGIHPHHLFKLKIKNEKVKIKKYLPNIEKLLRNNKVVAIGEVGLDRHVYESTKYSNYHVSNEFIELQKTVLQEQIKLAIKYEKSLILHNREAKKDMLEILHNVWDTTLDGRTVFHCCEPDDELLKFAKEHTIFIGVDGDVTYSTEKQEFVKHVPSEMLVLETDSPYLLPEPLRSQKKYPNKPENLDIISEFIARLKNIQVDELRSITTENGKKLFFKERGRKCH